MFLFLQNVLFYLVSDDCDGAKNYVFTEKTQEFNILLPYNGIRKVPGKTIHKINVYKYLKMLFMICCNINVHI